jgi:bacillithiol biosynthesis cysteine-adding enzyme BshC
MKVINSKEVEFYPSLINDYISGELNEKGIIDWEYSEDQVLKNAINRNFSKAQREILFDVLKEQYRNCKLTEEEEKSLSLLNSDNSYTITTGHQLNLLGGSQFFYTKILDVIRFSKKMSKDSKFDFVPVFWMATEDHDYEEISSVSLFGKKITCPGVNRGPVGRMSNSYFKDFLIEVETILGDGERFKKIKEIISTSFNESATLAEITRTFVRALFSDKGLLIIDGDHKALKQQFSKAVQQEVSHQTTFKAVNQQIALLANYKIQVNPREINLFYIEDNSRDRIVKTDNGYSTVANLKSWSLESFKKFTKSNAESISPNVLLRPLYQETILPNVAYMGGAGEISYWLELEPMFKEFDISFPLPIVRTSYFVVSEKQMNWLENKGVDFKDLFGNKDKLFNDLIKKIGSSEISLNFEKTELQDFYKKLLKKAKSISPDLEKVILGEEKRALGSLINVEKRFSNAEKKNHEQTISKLENIISKVFPNGSPMERVESFIPVIVREEFEFPEVENLFKGEIIVVS